MPQLIVDDVMISYLQKGRGPDVLLLHGWGNRKEGFKGLVDSLADRYRLTVLDLPGFGDSQAPPEAWDLSDYAEFLNKFATKLSLKPYAVIGHSNGGALAIHALSRGNLKVKKLALIAASGVRDQHRLRKLGIKSLAKTGKLMTFWLPTATRRKLRQRLYGTVGSDMLVAPHLQETFKKTVRQDIQADATTLKLPVLLLYGDRDKATPVQEVGERLHQLIADSELVVLHGAAHFVHHDEPEKTQTILRRFLA